ncbi:MAG TPA: response regulator [Bacteroidia bacterium]|jgi:CheY-like chemotaxis protein
MIKIKNLWLIDDDEIFVFLTKKTILKTSFEGNVTVFTNGKQALDALVNNKGKNELLPGVIFLDLSMPVMDGWGFLEEFILMKHKFEAPITIYIVSSSVSPNEIMRAKGMSEVLDFIIKPVSRERFIDIIQNL